MPEVCVLLGGCPRLAGPSTQPWLTPSQNQFPVCLLTQGLANIQTRRFFYLFIFKLLAAPRGMWDLSSLTRD